MLFEGYVPDYGAQHKTVVEMTSAIYFPFSDAIFLVKKVLTEVKSKNPQLELKFDLNDK